MFKGIVQSRNSASLISFCMAGIFQKKTVSPNLILLQATQFEFGFVNNHSLQTTFVLDHHIQQIDKLSQEINRGYQQQGCIISNPFAYDSINSYYRDYISKQATFLDVNYQNQQLFQNFLICQHPIRLNIQQIQYDPLQTNLSYQLMGKNKKQAKRKRSRRRTGAKTNVRIK